MTKPKKRRRRPWLLLGLLLVAVSVVVYGAGPGQWFGQRDDGGVEGVPVRRGPLRITVVERGNLESRDAVELKSEVEGQSTILWLIQEGTLVDEGDVLCELDATKLDESRVQQEIALSNAEAAHVKAQQALEIQVSQNESDVSAAERELAFAQLDLRKYQEGEWPQLLKAADEDIKLAEEELSQAQVRLQWSQRLAEKGFLTAQDLEEDDIAAQRFEIKLERARRAKELLEQYDHPRNLSLLQADADEAAKRLERAKLQAEARLVDAQTEVRTSKDRLGLEQERLDKLLAQIDKATMRAPVAGMVVYAQQEGGRFGSSDPIAEGTSVRERQAIITIPAVDGGMQAEASLHESVLEQVQVGQSCTITVDALPGRTFQGRVAYKAVLPDKNSWWANPNLRLYRTQVEILEVTPAMRPGMSCSLEILSEEIPDTLYVPVQSIFVDRGETVCFVSDNGGTELRPVEVGRHSAKWVQVLDGLREGEIVLLSQPAGFALQPALEGEEEEEEEGGEGPASPGGQPGAARPAGGPPAGGDGGRRGDGGEGRGERGGPPAAGGEGGGAPAQGGGAPAQGGGAPAQGGDSASWGQKRAPASGGGR